MKKKIQKVILFGGVGLIILIFLIFISSTLFAHSKIGEKISPIQIIKFSNNNASITITKNNMDKTANIDMSFYVDSEKIHTDLVDLTPFTTKMMCGVISIAFFDPDALEEFNKQINGWDEMNGVIENDKGEKQGIPKGNVLEGYKITKVKLAIKDEITKDLISDCIITGKSEENININYY